MGGRSALAEAPEHCSTIRGLLFESAPATLVFHKVRKEFNYWCAFEVQNLASPTLKSNFGRDRHWFMVMMILFNQTLSELLHDRK
ncbi:MAG TPA: hypothetical protein DD473_20115 [Planctomycetaceae bacterium]|nr:hypothetical protein [Planctomycetaceae bacterium]